jgi:hypothetical protein
MYKLLREKIRIEKMFNKPHVKRRQQFIKAARLRGEDTQIFWKMISELGKRTKV